MTSRFAVPETRRARLNRLMMRITVSVVAPIMFAISCLVNRMGSLMP